MSKRRPGRPAGSGKGAGAGYTAGIKPVSFRPTRMQRRFLEREAREGKITVSEAARRRCFRDSDPILLLSPREMKNVMATASRSLDRARKDIAR